MMVYFAQKPALAGFWEAIPKVASTAQRAVQIIYVHNTKATILLLILLPPHLTLLYSLATPPANPSILARLFPLATYFPSSVLFCRRRRLISLSKRRPLMYGNQKWDTNIKTLGRLEIALPAYLYT